MNYPLVSIIIATSNSAKTLGLTLESIRQQSYPQKKIEILVIDGQSRDDTLKIAKRFKVKIINNPQIGFIPAKHLGFIKAKGTYAMYLDSDEQIESMDGIKTKISAFLLHKKIKAVISTGYKNPENFPAINRYINEFGDPFSYFVYGEGMNWKFFLPRLKKKYPVVYEDANSVSFNFSEVKPLPLVELVAMGCMIDLSYIRKTFPEIKKNPQLVTHYFYLINRDRKLVAVTKNDRIIHYSAATFKTYLSKIAWRIRNNIFNKSTIGQAGFEGRDVFQPFWFRFKRYLFILYSFSIFLPLFDGIYLTLSRRDWIFLLHPFLSIYASGLILYYYLLYVMDIVPTEKRYGA